MPEPQGEALAEEVAHQLLTIHRYLRRYTKQVSAELGINGRQLATLLRLQEAGPLSVGQISGYLYIADSTTSEQLDALEARGLVTRTRSSEDNRVAIVALTPAGEDLARRAPLAGVGLLRHRLRSTPPEQVAALAQALAQLGQLMEIDAQQPR